MTKPRVYYVKGVTEATRRTVTRTLTKFLAVSPVVHRLPITVVPQDIIRDSITDDTGIGLFVEPELHIYVATGHTTQRQIRRTLLHELVHYEQFRDDRKVQEYGVNNRVNGLLKRLGYK